MDRWMDRQIDRQIAKDLDRQLQIMIDTDRRTMMDGWRTMMLFGKQTQSPHMSVDATLLFMRVVSHSDIAHQEALVLVANQTTACLGL